MMVLHCQILNVPIWFLIFWEYEKGTTICNNPKQIISFRISMDFEENSRRIRQKQRFTVRNKHKHFWNEP